MAKDSSIEKDLTPKKRSWGSRILRGVMWLLIFFAILLGTITMLFRMESFQNYAANWLTDKLSKDLDSTVELQHIDFKIFDNLVLDSFFVEDQHGDTLLFSEKLTVSFNSGLYSLYKMQLEIDEVTLQNAQLNIRRREGEPQNNLNLLLSKLFPPKEDDPNQEKQPFYFDLNKLFLENVNFLQDDVVKGERINVFVKKGIIELDKVDLENNLVVIQSADFEDSIVSIDNMEHKPLPVDTTQIALKEVPDAETEIPDSLQKPPLRFLVHNFDFGNGKFSLHNYRKAPIKTTPTDEIDWDHLEVFNINIDIDSFEMSEMKFTGDLKKLSAEDSSGFVLENLSAPDVLVTSRRTELNGVSLITPLSNVQDTIVFKYRSFDNFNDFEEKVIMDLKFDKSFVSIQDVLTFAPKLKKNQFFADNANEVIRLDGRVRGRVNNLRGDDLKLVLGRNTFIEGDFSSRDLTVKGNESLNLGLTKFKSNIRTIRQLLPNLNLPENFDRLGNIDFKGRFDGFFVDFVAYGDLKTDLGRATMDMRLDLKPGREKANYSGSLNLVDFDLATWTRNRRFGNITVTSKISDGVGLSQNTAKAKIDATVDKFNFRGYTYRDFNMDGQLTQSFFDGKFDIKDKNIDFDFNGSVDFRDSVPVFDFKAKVNTLNFDELFLAKEDLGLSGEMELKIRDVNISNLTGNANFRNLVLQRNGDERYEADTLSFNSFFGDDGQRVFAAHSELFEGEIHGNYDIQEIPDAFLLFMEKNYPEISQKVGIKAKRENLKSTDFDFDVKIIDSKNFTYLIDTKLDTIKNFMINGHYDGINYEVSVDLALEQLTYDNIEVGGIKWNTNALGSVGKMSSLVPFYAILNGKNYIPKINISGRLNRDTIQFEVGATGEKETYDRFNIGGKLFFEKGIVNISLANDSLLLFGEEWEISEDNFIQFGKKLMETEGFVLKNRDRTVSVDDIDKKGVHLRLENFNTGFIDSVWNYRQLDFAGDYSIDVKAKDIYNLKDFQAQIVSDTFWVNGDDWGKLEINTSLADLKSELNANLSIQRGLRELNLDGYYILPFTEKISDKSGKTFANKSFQKDYLDFKLNLTNYPLNIADYFIGLHTSETEGLVDLEAHLTGKVKEINSVGSAKIYNGAITVNYLNTRYFFGQDDPVDVKITNSLFDFSGNTLTDKYGNIGYVEGGITHTNLRYPGLNTRLYADKILALDTDKLDNPLYYGHAIGQIDATFNGLFKYTNVVVNATPGKGSKIFIPITSSVNTDDTGFIVFRDKNKKEEGSGVGSEIRGMEVDMNINMTPDAEVSLIIDERAGDIIRGKGSGPMQMKVPRSGDITLYGEYLIEEGDYLFTMVNVVNKRFKVETGGRILWTGDPLRATIDLKANYDRLKTSVYNFIQEYAELGDEDLKTQARKSTDVDLKMDLTGDLLKPEINFDISFPNLVTGNVKNYVDTKLRILREDQNEMNRQVFGLIVIGGFLPSGQETLAGSEITASGINTVSEYLSHRLSMYFTELLTEAFSDVGFISGVDFDIEYNIYDSGTVTIGNGNDPVVLAGSEMEIGLNSRLWDDKFSINGSVLRSTETTSGGTFIGGDFVAEYFLTEDRRFKVRFYHRTSQDLDGSRRDRTGLGINYRRQFNTFKEFIGGMKKSAKKSAGAGRPNG